METEIKIYGLTRIRNESAIIQESLDHLSRFCTGGIFVFDDASEDNTAEICSGHFAVKEIVLNKKWEVDTHGQARGTFYRTSFA